MVHFDSKWGIYRMKCTFAIVKLAAELAFCGCYTTTSAPEEVTFLPFWLSKSSFIANSLLLPQRNALEKKHENRLKIG